MRGCVVLLNGYEGLYGAFISAMRDCMVSLCQL